ncbi:energy transducer TonB [Cerasicoccus maritimus]|uniref:energy transducer TonB n=1 Tax=Cerasicoccus maritimus TaxID=490089 RepID=UPI002852C20B|nr:energy transducer TonB [Cerasicoccus maritimus]
MSQTLDAPDLLPKAASFICAVLVTGALFTFVVPLSHWLAKEPQVIENTQVELFSYEPPPPPPQIAQSEPMLAQQAADASAAAPRPLGEPIELQALPTNSPALAGFATGLLEVDEFPVEMTGLAEIPVFEVVDLDSIPQMVSSPPREKPYELQRAGVSGAVRLKVLISPAGFVSVVEVLSYDDERLIKYAKRFAEKCRFEPPMHNNQPVTATYVFPIGF